ncbi:MAG: hypothetical protein HOG95_09955 [Rhodospirillaceae bacterium]|jgi:hypothetical protein|nr:hypothetical protein [Rhodospirillaceae bacterium]MBT5940245.1 hypothetical protein [Rhodospirillaceae bacterium]MBT7267286.1 hypothetical protein [Rhodospirillaceae bacterium]
MKALLLSLVAVFFISSAAPVSAAPKNMKADPGIYQIVKATENRVWRLNKNSGEISVCTLDGEHLLCTSSSNATDIPKQSYAERQAAKQRSLEAEKMRREEQRKKDLAFLDRVIEAVRSLVRASVESEK